jgi:DNA-binding Xre family transcriptional regulator
VEQTGGKKERIHPTEPINPTRLVGERIAEIRKNWRVMTQEGLADAMKTYGIGWERITVAKLESGRRSFVKLDELLALCVVLDISLVDLLVPADLDESQLYRVTPEITARAHDVRDWLRGEAWLVTYGHHASARSQASAQPTAADIAALVQWMPEGRGREVMARWLEEQKQQEEDRE